MTREEFKAKVSMAYGGRETLEEFLEAVWQLHLEASNHWIPVEEKFPEENTTPLVRMDLSDKFNEETIIYDVVVFDQNGFHTPYKVTYWMEIQPPRKEE